jgi:hypothetical protein
VFPSSDTHCSSYQRGASPHFQHSLALVPSHSLLFGMQQHRRTHSYSFQCFWCVICGWSVSAQDSHASTGCMVSSSLSARKSSALIQFGSVRKSTVTHAPSFEEHVGPKRVEDGGMNNTSPKKKKKPKMTQSKGGEESQTASKGHYEKGTCVNVQDNYPSTEWQGLWFCNQSVAQGLFNSTCKHELLLKDCDRECGLCACTTARGLYREHCSGHGTCSADCDNFGCKDAHCVCAVGWTGPKCEQKKGDSNVQMLSVFPASLHQRLKSLRSDIQRIAIDKRKDEDVDVVTRPPSFRRLLDL